MAKAKASLVSTRALIQLSIGFFFLMLGITGIIPQAGESIFGLSRDRTTLEIVFGVVEVACGLFFLFDAIRSVPRKTSMMVLLVVLVLVSEFIQGIDLHSSGIVFYPSFFGWFLVLSIDLVVASVLWFLYKSE
jgi:hypothetical protein